MMIGTSFLGKLFGDLWIFQILLMLLLCESEKKNSDVSGRTI